MQAKRLDFVEEAGAPPGVQVSGGFIQQQYRVWLRFCTRKPRRLSQNQVQNQGLLFAGGTFRRRTILFAVDYAEIASVRTGQGAAGGGVARARPRQRRRQAGLDLGGLDPGRGQGLPLAGELQPRLGERPFGPNRNTLLPAVCSSVRS